MLATISVTLLFWINLLGVLFSVYMHVSELVCDPTPLDWDPEDA